MRSLRRRRLRSRAHADAPDPQTNGRNQASRPRSSPPSSAQAHRQARQHQPLGSDAAHDRRAALKASIGLVLPPRDLVGERTLPRLASALGGQISTTRAPQIPTTPRSTARPDLPAPSSPTRPALAPSAHETPLPRPAPPQSRDRACFRPSRLRRARPCSRAAARAAVGQPSAALTLDRTPEALLRRTRTAPRSTSSRSSSTSSTRKGRRRATLCSSRRRSSSSSAPSLGSTRRAHRVRTRTVPAARRPCTATNTTLLGTTSRRGTGR